MRNHTYRLFGITAAALFIAAGTAGAQGKGHGEHDGDEHGNGRGRGNAERVDERNDREHDRDNRGYDNQRNVYRGNGAYDEGRRVPPGLAKKPGQMPPGQYRKRYSTNDGVNVLTDVFGRRGYQVVRTQPYGTSRYVYYRAPNGLVQRAVVTPGTDRLGFSNVPMAIVQEVLARLY